MFTRWIIISSALFFHISSSTFRIRILISEKTSVCECVCVLKFSFFQHSTTGAFVRRYILPFSFLLFRWLMINSAIDNISNSPARALLVLCMWHLHTVGHCAVLHAYVCVCEPERCLSLFVFLWVLGCSWMVGRLHFMLTFQRCLYLGFLFFSSIFDDSSRFVGMLHTQRNTLTTM